MLRRKLRQRGLVCPSKRQCSMPGLYSLLHNPIQSPEWGTRGAHPGLHPLILFSDSLRSELGTQVAGVEGSREQMRWELLSPPQTLLPPWLVRDQEGGSRSLREPLERGVRALPL